MILSHAALHFSSRPAVCLLQQEGEGAEQPAAAAEEPEEGAPAEDEQPEHEQQQQGEEAAGGDAEMAEAAPAGGRSGPR